MNMLTFPSRVVLAAAGCAALILSACGGGGDAGTAASPLEFPLASVAYTHATTAVQFNLAGALDGVNITLSYSQNPGAASSFEGKPASTAVQRMVLRSNGVLAFDTTLTSYFAANPYVAYGSIDQSDGGYSVFTQTPNFPVTARIGQSGVIGSSIDYADFQKNVVTKTSTVSWSLEADSATTAMFSVNTLIAGTPSFTGSECLRVDANGVVSGLVLKIDFSGKTLILS